MLAAVDIGNINAAIGTDKSVMRLSDEHAVRATNDGPALAQRKFNHAGIERILFRPCNRLGARLDRGQINQPSLCLGNNLMFDDKNVAELKPDSPPPERFHQLVRKRIARENLVSDKDGDQTKLTRSCR